MIDRKRQQFWLDEYQRIIRETLTFYQPFFPAHPVDPVVDRCLGELNKTLSMMSDSVVLLAINERLWEAAMLDRTIQEGTTKFLFICTQDAEEREVRVGEFRYALPDIALLRDHRRAEALLNVLGDKPQDELRPIREVLLSARELARIQASYSRKRRAQLEQKWSFASMVDDISQSRFPGIDAYASMLFGYSMSSHLIHMDGVGLGMILDREQREPVRLNAMNCAHTARLFSEQVQFAVLRAAYCNWLKGLPIEHIIHDNTREKFLADLDQANKEWHGVEYST